MTWIWRCCGCGIGHSYGSNLTPSLGTSIYHECSPEKTKKKKKKILLSNSWGQIYVYAAQGWARSSYTTLRISVLIFLELSSFQAPSFLVHWLEIQGFHFPVLSSSSCDCFCYQSCGPGSCFSPLQSACYHFTFPCPSVATQCIFSRDFNCNQWETRSCPSL